MQHNYFVKDEKRKGLNPILFGHEDCTSGHLHGPAVRPFWLIHYIESGKGIFRIGGNEYSLTKNDMFIIPPGVETFYQADKLDPWVYTWIGFTTDDGPPYPLPDTLNIPEAAEIFREMKSCTRFKNGRGSYLCARLWDLFAIISDSENSAVDYVDSALDWIYAEYMTNLTVEKIASRLNIDRTYFSVIFKEKTGLSPKQYITTRRMNTAASLLAKSHLSVTTVSSYVGYTDPFTFSKSFKRFFGMSPTEYLAKAVDKDTKK